MIRLLLLLGYLTFFLISRVPYYLLYPIWNKNGKTMKRYQSAAKKVDRAFDRCLKISGTTITVDGLEHIPADTAVLYVGNHSSYFDILTLFHAIPGGAGFVAKAEMAKIPLLKQWMLFINCLFLDRKDIKQGMATIRSAADHIKQGCSMVIFPEGTRNQKEELLEFKEGSLRIASMAKAPIVPVALSGTADIFENNPGFCVKPAHVHITFGEPIYMHELPRAEKKQVGASIRQWIMDTKGKNL